MFCNSIFKNVLIKLEYCRIFSLFFTLEYFGIFENVLEYIIFYNIFEVSVTLDNSGIIVIAWNFLYSEKYRLAYSTYVFRSYRSCK